MKNLAVFVWEAWNDVTLIILTVAAVASLVLSLYQPSSSPAANDIGKGKGSQVVDLYSASTRSVSKVLRYGTHC